MTSSANHFQQFKNYKVVVFLVYILIREKKHLVLAPKEIYKDFFVVVVFLFVFALIGSHTYLSGLIYVLKT